MSSALFDRLKQYGDADALRLHMPGHGGALSPFDVTELSATDDLMDPALDGAILQDEMRAAELFSSRLTLFCTGGATLALQTAIVYQVTRMRRGARIFCERGVHRSILHALAILDIMPVFIESAQSLSEREVARGDLLIFTGCDYFGRVPDYASLSAFCKRCGLYSVVDNAHGTHLRFLDGGKLHPIVYGFDLVVDSAHKTLSCLTGASLLHVGSSLCAETEEIRAALLHAMRILGSTSPSFLILLSLTEALSEIAAGFDGENYAPFSCRAQLISSVCEACSLTSAGADPMRLSLTQGYDFPALGKALEEESIFAELCQENGLVLLFPETFGKEGARRLTEVLLRTLPRVQAPPRVSVQLPLPRMAATLHEALFSPSEEVPIDHAAGRIAAEVVGHYPPGTALCMPGEILEKDVLSCLNREHVRVLKKDVL